MEKPILLHNPVKAQNVRWNYPTVYSTFAGQRDNHTP